MQEVVRGKGVADTDEFVLRKADNDTSVDIIHTNPTVVHPFTHAHTVLIVSVMIKIPLWAGRHISFLSRKEHVKFFERTLVKDHHSLLDASSAKVATCPPMCVLVRNCLSLRMHICLWCMSLQLQSFFFLHSCTRNCASVCGCVFV